MYSLFLILRYSYYIRLAALIYPEMFSIVFNMFITKPSLSFPYIKPPIKFFTRVQVYITTTSQPGNPIVLASIWVGRLKEAKCVKLYCISFVFLRSLNSMDCGLKAFNHILQSSSEKH